MSDDYHLRLERVSQASRKDLPDIRGLAVCQFAEKSVERGLSFHRGDRDGRFFTPENQNLPSYTLVCLCRLLLWWFQLIK